MSESYDRAANNSRQDSGNFEPARFATRYFTNSNKLS